MHEARINFPEPPSDFKEWKLRWQLVWNHMIQYSQVWTIHYGANIILFYLEIEIFVWNYLKLVISKFPINFPTRMYSSRMRIARSSTVGPPPRTETPSQTPLPPVNRITDRCKNITFPQLRLRAVKMLIQSYCQLRRIWLFEGLTLLVSGTQCLRCCEALIKYLTSPFFSQRKICQKCYLVSLKILFKYARKVSF